METVSVLQTVQLIPIFSYLNILSDFLFMEDYLSEFNQTKQIPIVNALYQYLEKHRNDQLMIEKLIRTLLKGSDLYGEEEFENFDVTFANAMFDYIISSLVFDKYSNIYGFLANVIRSVENLQLNYVLSVAKENLQSATFENEDGSNSKLSPLSVNRIHNDMILPLFPRPKANFSLISLDYIYAQAGLMFLRPGRLNTTYYADSNCRNDLILDEDRLFDEYLVIGHAIETLLLTYEKNLKLLHAFALPAITCYIFNSKPLYENENITNIIVDPNFWQAAFEFLFEYTVKVSNDTNERLRKDYNFNMHMSLSTFRTRTTLAKRYIDLYCSRYPANMRLEKFYIYLKAEYFKCHIHDELYLPDLNELLESEIDEIADIYKRHDLQLVKKTFGKFVINSIIHDQVVIKLLAPIDKVKFGDFSNSKQLSYDLLEFYFSNSDTFDYYALLREDYNVTLINYSENPQLFQEKINFTLDKIFNETIPVILKFPNESINVFWENLMSYKEERLQSYLKFLDEEKKEGKNDSWKSNWWKEFGFSLVPYYPCLNSIDYKNHNCTVNTLKFLNEFHENITSKIIHTNTRSYLSSLGTTIKVVELQDLSQKTINKMLSLKQEYRLPVKNASFYDQVLQNISFHIEEPAFGFDIITNDNVNLIKGFIDSLIQKSNFEFMSVKGILNVISVLKSYFFKTIGDVGEIKIVSLHVKSIRYLQDLTCDSGYGYKFINLSKTEIAELRTNYERKDKVLISAVKYLPDDKNVYTVINFTNIEPEPTISLYEMRNKLLKNDAVPYFSGISIYVDNARKCNMDTNFFIPHADCPRQKRKLEKNNYVNEAVGLLKNALDLSEEQIRDTLRMYTFLSDKKILTNFTKEWFNSKKLKAPSWGENYKINNSDLLDKLRYDFRFEYYKVPVYDFIITSIYSCKERDKIEEGTSNRKITQDYIDQNFLRYSVTFQDYYAIRNYATTGYTRITGDTVESMQMKIALYKLAIRQSDDPIEEFDLKLFSVESRPIDVINKEYSVKDEIILRKFMLASTSAVSATRHAAYPVPGFINVLYEMVFSEPYLRAKIKQTDRNGSENKVILLSGSEFSIENMKTVDIGGLGSVLKIKLIFKHNSMEKYMWYKKLINEIVRLKNLKRD